MQLKELENKTVLIWKMAIASAISWEVAKLVGSDHPYLAPLSVVLCLQTTVYQSIFFSIHRVVGTVIGVITTVYLVSRLSMNGWMLGLLMLGGTFIAKWLRRDETVLHQVALTILFIFVFERNSKGYAMDRIVDTIVGAVIALLIHMFFYPPDYTKQAAASVGRLTRQISDIFAEVSHWIEFEWGQGKSTEVESSINQFQQELSTAKTLLKSASKSLKFNPFGKKHKFNISRCQSEIQKLEKAHTYLSTVTGNFKNWEKELLLTPGEQADMGRQIKNFSNHFKNVGTSLQIETDKWDKTEQATLYHVLNSELQALPQVSHEGFKGSFYIATSNFLKELI
ncbi:aromatic acid exporter family protein [Cytobacillus oceanisediminis]|uniref:FUSC family protein n=1 Tax=Cytobacillus oceanisediminis TaxID=665099 RepID=UPI0011A54D3E|nr:FUSC family protein [Cytobacillus oceanisediminis]